MDLIQDKKLKEKIEKQTRNKGYRYDEVPRKNVEVIESKRTAITYLINLFFFIFMCIVLVGVLMIYLVILLEGSLYVNPIILVHITIPAFILGLNIYVITLEDNKEYKFLRKGSGFFLLNFAFLSSVIGLGIAVFMRMSDDPSNEYQKDPADEGVLFIEECVIHALAVIESFTLKEYAKAKYNDFLAGKKVN